MKYQLILQWPASSIDDYDSMIEVEDLLIEQLSDDGQVDGHDAGSGEVNIFILTNFPERVFKEAQAIFATHDVATQARAAFREIGKDDYTVLWPKGSKEFAIA